jgi:MYXO-CTERM domain-containing protein
VDQPSQTPAQIEAEIEATRTRLAGTVDELATRVQPKEIARRSAEDAKARLQAATHTDDGSLRTERVAAVGAAAALLAALAAFRAVRRRRS